MLTKVKDNSSYVRDMTNRAILNVDSNGLDSYKIKKRAMQQQKDNINNLTNDVNQLKDEITEIKSLLMRLLDK